MDTGGKKILPICKDCFSKFVLLNTNGIINYSHIKLDKEHGKQMGIFFTNGHIQNAQFIVDFNK